MEIINRCLNLSGFSRYVRDYDFGPRPADKIVLHHTWRPSEKNWKGEESILRLKHYYEKKGWPAGPHLFIATEGIWLFSSMNKDGVHAGRLNKKSIGIEVVGAYDRHRWSGHIRRNALGAIQILMDRLRIPQPRLFFHREVASTACPGRAITKEWLFRELGKLA